MKQHLNFFLIIITLLLFNSLLNAQNTTIRTEVHIIRHSDGNGMTEQTARDAIDTLNNFYKNTNMKFIIDKIIIVNTSSTTLNFDLINCFAVSINNLQDPINPNALNIYFFPSLSGGNKGVAFQVPGNACAVSYDFALSSTLAHEVGHCFGLFHTNEFCNGFENIVRTYDPVTNCSPNWDVAGDKIKDTPAQRHSQGSSADGCGITYPTTNPNLGNIMDFVTAVALRTYFTFNQRQKMENILQNVLSNLKFKVDIIASNKINNINQFGTTLHIDGQFVNSGNPINLLYGINHISKTDNEILSTNFKHHDWDNDFSQYKLTENYNIDINNLNRDANFLQLNNSSVKNKLIEYSNIEAGNIDFLDPWWVDLSGNQPNVFNTLTSSSVNVFLNQGINPQGQWVPPYYSVKAQSPQNINLGGALGTHKFYFQNWGGTDVTFQDSNSAQTAVVFNSSNAVAEANLKGTQLSNNINAFSNNSQRKFVRTPNGNLHLVYESMGKAWYEISTDNGATWQIANGGQSLSGSNESKLPSIDYKKMSGSTNLVVIVWQEKDGGSYDIKMAEFINGNHTYVPTATIFMDVYLPYSTNTNPVV